MATPKQEEIKVRVTTVMKAKVAALAEQRGESESVIVREALNAYLLRDDALATNPEPSAIASTKPVRYKISRKQRKPAA